MSNRRKSRHYGGEAPTKVSILVGETVSIATLEIDGVITTLGEAKRAPGDVWSPEAGTDLALGRALRKAGDELLRRHGVKA